MKAWLLWWIAVSVHEWPAVLLVAAYQTGRHAHVEWLEWRSRLNVNRYEDGPLALSVRWAFLYITVWRESCTRKEHAL